MLTPEQASELLVMLGEDGMIRAALGVDRYCLITQALADGSLFPTIAYVGATGLGPERFWTGTEWAPL
jgi:hypothetical protein